MLTKHLFPRLKVQVLLASLLCLSLPSHAAKEVKGKSATPKSAAAAAAKIPGGLTASEAKTVKEGFDDMAKSLFDKHYTGGEAQFNKSKVHILGVQAKQSMMAGKLKEAIADLTKAIECHATKEGRGAFKTEQMARFDLSQEYTARGACYLELKDNTKALADMTKAIQTCPDYATPYVMRARVYRAMNNDRAAFEDTAKSSHVQDLPKFLTDGLMLSSKMAAAGEVLRKREDAMRTKAFEKYYYPGRYENSNFMKFYKEASTALHADNYGKAADKFTSAIVVFSDPTEKPVFRTKGMANFKLAGCYQGRSYCHIVNKDWDRAISDLSSAIKLFPFQQESYINRGNAYLKLGKKKEAEADFSKAKTVTEVPDSFFDK